MKRVFLGMFFTVALFTVVGCSSSSSSADESTTDECLEDPNLPICQGPDNGPDDGLDDGPGLSDEL
ncbi:MAG: hypothetical protein IKH55_11630 [Fibrobacter sp.]|jgi:hypothetical protein|nr:hypothetical protein [Fibrobacter sp.]